MLASPSTLVASSAPPADAANDGRRSGRVTSRDLVLAGCTLLLAAVLTGGANLVFTVVAAAPALLASIRLIQKKKTDTEAKNSVLLYWAVLAAFTLVEGLMPESHTASYALFKAFVLLAVGGHVFLKTKTDLFAAAIGVVDGLAEDLDTCLSALSPLTRSPNYPPTPVPAWPTPVSPTPTVLSPGEVEAIELASLRTAMSITRGDLEELKLHETQDSTSEHTAIGDLYAHRSPPFTQRGVNTGGSASPITCAETQETQTDDTTIVTPYTMFSGDAAHYKVYLSGTAGFRHGALFVQNTSEAPLWWVLKTNHRGRLLAAPNHGALGVGEMVEVKLNETEAAKMPDIDTLAIDFVLNPPMHKFNEKVFHKAKPERHMIDIVHSE